MLPASLSTSVPVVKPETGANTLTTSPATMSAGLTAMVPLLLTVTLTVRVPSYTRLAAVTPVSPVRAMDLGVMVPVVLALLVVRL